MQLTQLTDYSLRTLIYVALQNQNCTISEISSAYDISKNHMIKIIHKLAKLELLITTRGKNGGVRLNPRALNIDFKALVVQLEPHFDLVPCFNPIKKNCCIAPACKLKNILHQAQEAFFDVLEQYTLEDALHPENELRHLLKI